MMPRPSEDSLPRHRAADAGPAASLRREPLRRFACVLGIIVFFGLAIHPLALAPARAVEPLKPVRYFKYGGDAYLRVEFRSTSNLRRERFWSGEHTQESISHAWTISGVLEVKTVASGDGKVTYSVLGVSNEPLSGSLIEDHTMRHDGMFGEDGLQKDTHTSVEETWRAPGVELRSMSTVAEVVIDLDAHTWSAPELADVFDSWISIFQEREEYEGRWEDENDKEKHTVISSDKNQPPPQCMGGNSPLRLSGTSAGTLGLREKLERPQRLSAMPKAKGAPDTLSATVEGELDIGEGSKIRGLISWAIMRDLPELELRVTSPGLKVWVPTGDRFPGVNDRLPGRPLEVTAEVVSPSGASLDSIRIRRMRWWLEETSRLPGVCMNWPYASQDTSPDLEIDHAKATDERQRLELTDLTTLRKTIKVVPYDFGGWSTLRVEAELDDGRTLQGKIEGQEGGDPAAIRLPARAVGSKVADFWKRLMIAGGKADDADDDDLPAGRTRGDGFTLFEEYRGFYIGENHQTGTPLIKDVFVYDRVRDDQTRAAIRLFNAATSASVHEIAPGKDELDDSRVVNRNRGDGPTRGAQHAVGLRRGNQSWRPETSARRPGQDWVNVTPPLRFLTHTPRLLLHGELYARAIAQAMFRACGVPRPGFGDRLVHLTVSRGPDGAPVVMASGLGRVTVRDEVSGHDLGEEWLATMEKQADVVRARLRGVAGAEEAAEAAAKAVANRKYFVALRGGQHSGPVGNIMRDAFADAYLIKETNTICVLSPSIPEKVGYELTETSKGDSYNATSGAAGPAPRTRYGDSAMPAANPAFTPNDHAE